MPRCLICDQYTIWPESHKCDPAWDVWFPESGETRDDAHKAYGMTASEAVESFAERHDSDSSMEAFSDHRGTIVAVAERGNNKITYLSVSREYAPTYCAEAADEDDIEALGAAPAKEGEADA